jgi:NADPH:quinone reductase-like Zn-dependent oxidoreductase
MPKALLISRPKGELIFQEVPLAKPQNGELLIENIAIAQNPVDWKQHDPHDR